MKKLELVVPEAVVRQVLVLVAELAEEVHLYNLASPPVTAVEAPLPKPSKPPRGNAGKPAFKPAVGAKDEIVAFIREHGPASALELRRHGESKGFASDTLVVQANKDHRKGDLVRLPDGQYDLARASDRIRLEA